MMHQRGGIVSEDQGLPAVHNTEVGLTTSFAVNLIEDALAPTGRSGAMSTVISSITSRADGRRWRQTAIELGIARDQCGAFGRRVMMMFI
jgi:hypothetical protein